MTAVSFPDGFHLSRLEKAHQRDVFDCGEERVNAWFKDNARQAMEKHLSVTRVLTTEDNEVAGFYTLAMGQVLFDALPPPIAHKLPKTTIPIITLAWLGVERRFQGQGLGKRLLASALHDCFLAGEQLPFIAVILDALSQASRRFYERFDFEPLPGHPMKLFLSYTRLSAMMTRRRID